MALKVKTEYVGIDKNGSNISIKDATGYYIPELNPTGYGNPNLPVNQIDSVVFTISNYNTSEVLKFTAPSIPDVVSGKEIILNANNLIGGLNTLQFEDGAYDLNEYVFVTDSFIISEAELGTPFVIVENTLTQDYLFKYDSIQDQLGNIYNIDKTKPFNANVIYLVEELLAEATTIKIGYRANSKFLNTRDFDYILGRQCLSRKDNVILDIFYHKQMAIHMFNEGDYQVANKLISKQFNTYC